MSLQIEKKQPVGKVAVEPKGLPMKETEIKVGPTLLVPKEEAFANVGMKVGKTINLGNYESVRVDVSLYMPCPPDDESINLTYDLVNTWVDLKMAEIMDEYEAAA